ncbi:unnamed protein product [Symbiodinium sp. CCMP2456]|nr:unnamed protein product [Symbiodinium sp. CCMP2456]
MANTSTNSTAVVPSEQEPEKRPAAWMSACRTPSEPGSPICHTNHHQVAQVQGPDGHGQWSWKPDAPEFVPHTNNMGTVANNMEMPGPVIMMMEAPPCFMVGGWVMAPNSDQSGGCNEAQNSNKTYTEEQESGDSRVMELQTQIENIRFTHEKEKQAMKRQIQAYQKILDRYDIPREEADAIIHHLDASEGSNVSNMATTWWSGMATDVSSTTMPMDGMMGGEQWDMTTDQSVEISNQPSPGSANGNTSSTKTIASELQALLPHAKVRCSNGESETPESRTPMPTPTSSLNEEVEKQMFSLEQMVNSKLDDRALMSLKRLSPIDGKEALRKVQEVIEFQGGKCHNLSSMLQSVCRKMEKRATQTK